MAQRYLEQKHRLGKGEVVSSILTGSTTKPHEIALSESADPAHSAVAGRTYPEDGSSKNEESVDSVHGAFRARSKPMTEDEDTIRDLLAWAKKQPRPVRSMANILAQQLRLQREYPENKALPHVIATSIKMLKDAMDKSRS